MLQARKGQEEVVSKSRNKIHQTWDPPFSRALYCWIEVVPERETCPVTINHDCDYRDCVKLQGVSAISAQGSQLTITPLYGYSDTV